MSAKICLVLTGKTLQENIDAIRKSEEASYNIDLLELRVDMLKHEELFKVQFFPSMVAYPVILTIRRKRDGGCFRSGEFARLLTFARALNMDKPQNKTFAYIDLELDTSMKSIEDVASILGIKIIRSYHSLNRSIKNYTKVVERLKEKKGDVIKIVSASFCLKDTMRLFEASKWLKDEEHILIAMGEYGILSRIMANFFGSTFLYVFSSKFINKNKKETELLNVSKIQTRYNFFNISKEVHFFGVLGCHVNLSLSPAYHNRIFREKKLKAVYVPLSAINIEEGLSMAEMLNVRALSVTYPFKEVAVQYARCLDPSVEVTGATNTLIFPNKSFYEGIRAYNTDIIGFEKSIKEFLAYNFSPALRVSVLGAGGTAKTICYVLKVLGFSSVVVFNRTYDKARALASLYHFEAAPLDVFSINILKEHCDLIINTTSLGMAEEENISPIPFYHFTGSEYVFDMVYRRSFNKKSFKKGNLSSLLLSAKGKGCKICDGRLMFKYQAVEQAKIFYKEISKKC